MAVTTQRITSGENQASVCITIYHEDHKIEISINGSSGLFPTYYGRPNKSDSVDTLKALKEAVEKL